MKGVKQVLGSALVAAGLSVSVSGQQVISLNFDKDTAAVSGPGGDGSLAGDSIVADSWNNYSGKDATSVPVSTFWDGEGVQSLLGVTATWSSFGVYHMNNYVAAFQKGYLNDYKTQGVDIGIDGIPFANYSVIIYYTTDSPNFFFSAPKVNGTYYTCNGSGQTSEGSDAWGAGNVYSVALGSNAIRIDGLSGKLSINGGGMETSVPRRASIGAVQVVNTGAPVVYQTGTVVRVSSLNDFLSAKTDASYRIVMDADATLLFDEALDLPDGMESVTVCSGGNLTLSKQGGTTPEDTADIEFEVSGTVFYAGDVRAVVSLNFNSGAGAVSGPGDDGALAGTVVADSWNNFSGGTSNAVVVAKMWNDGAVRQAAGIVASWDSNGTWSHSKYVAPFQKGHITDYTSKDTSITVDGIPFETYSVLIYYSTDSPQYKFSAPKVNGVFYTCDARGQTSAGSTAWGSGAVYSPTFGQNAIRIDGLNGKLTISGGGMVISELRRASIGAIQIVDTGSVPVFYLEGDDTKVSKVNEFLSRVSGETAKVIVPAGGVLEFDQSLLLPAGMTSVQVVGLGDLTLSKNGGVRPEDVLGMDFTVSGKLIWGGRTAEVLSVNFMGPAGVEVKGDDDDGSLAGSIPANAWNNIAAVQGEKVVVPKLWNGEGVQEDTRMRLTWSGFTNVNISTYGAVFQKGYLDDYIAESATKSVKINISRVPFSQYSVILYYVTDSPSYGFSAPKVNDRFYTCDASGIVSEGSDAWGTGSDHSVAYGKNAIRIDGLSGPLSIDCGKFVRAESRGSCAALQVVNTGEYISRQGAILIFR